MKIDIALEPVYTADEIAELGSLAERRGIETVWVTNDPLARDVFQVFARLAETTRRIRLGVMAISPVEMHPLKLANALLTLNELSAGRASVVIGSGGAVLAHSRFDLTRRVRAVAECIEILKSIDPGTRLGFSGQIYTIRNYQPVWATDEPPRILAGANQSQMLRMAARQADGILMSDMPLQLVPAVKRTLEEGLERQGRSPAEFEVNNFWAWHVKNDPSLAAAEARSRLVLRGMLKRSYIEPFLSDADAVEVEENMPNFYQAYRERSEKIDGVSPRIVEALIDNLTLTAGIAELDRRLEILERFQQAGLTRITLGLHDDPADSIRLIGERVIPALQS